MTRLRSVPAYCSAFDEDDGTRKSPGASGYVTLGVDTYFFPIDAQDSLISSIHIQTDGTIAGTFSLEVCNMPYVDITDWDDSASSPWVKYDATTAYIPTNGTGWTVTNMTMVKTAGVGNAFVDLGNSGAARLRLRADITTAGTVRVCQHGKD